MPLEIAVGAVIPHYFRETRIRVVGGKNTTIIVRNFFPPRFFNSDLHLLDVSFSRMRTVKLVLSRKAWEWTK